MKTIGRGLICHRLLRSICQLVGIHDMYAKVEGATRNYRALARGFLQMLNAQRSYQQLAEDSGLHIVEFSPQNGMVPIVLASPPPGQVRKNILAPSRLSSTSSSGDDQFRPHPGAFEKTLILLSNPLRRPVLPILKPQLHTTFIDDLTFETSNYFAYRDKQVQVHK
ncbi:unnamed protein product [Protopolystoma xenopodis]|uniref:Small ribosomal subunit protein uS5 C-terminal domain-containing protein n=1 Tax=Protopolystoma xenopodis TaxID=117903 RepID=A0A448WGX5_9PLAT|nr:unnamed protein product [Protopolystoma xenopodis]